MPVRNSTPLPWRGKSLSDSVDGSTAFNGAMSSLQNLIPDPTTADLWQCRPAIQVRATFSGTTGSPFSSGFSTGFQQGGAGTVGAVSALRIVGDVAYGMVGNTADGLDHPFAFNLLTNAFIPIIGVHTVGILTNQIINADLPTSQPVTGPWTPPIMDVIGSKVILTHVGFLSGAAAGVSWIGVFDISTPTAPTYQGRNITGVTTFTTGQVPTGVAQFSNRAYYIFNLTSQPVVIFSDVLNPINTSNVPVTNTVPVISFGDSSKLTCFGQLRFFNQLGGIIQALVVFKSTSNMYQITGDSGLQTLAVNAMNLATGTLSPLSVCSTPKGLAFMSPEGLRVVDFQSNISDPIGVDGSGVCAPFIYSAQPTRISAACNGSVLRMTTQNTAAVGTPFQEFWFDFARKKWHGPHTCAAGVIEPYNNTFIMSKANLNGFLFQSDPVQSATSTFIEVGDPLNWVYQTTFLPDSDTMAPIAVSQATLDLQLAASSPPISIVSIDQNSQVIDSVQIAQLGSASIWGSLGPPPFFWGSLPWGSAVLALAPRILPWHFPLTFAKAQFSASGQSAGAIRVGAWHFRYKVLRYLVDITAVA